MSASGPAESLVVSKLEALPRRRLVTFLGTGQFDKSSGMYRYEATRYALGDLPPVETPFVARAICGFVDVGQVRILATDKAWSIHGNALFEALRDSGVEDVTHVRIPDGGSEAALWELFEHLKEQLRPQSGWEIVLDITHGFRCQPFYAAAALSFVRAVDEDPAPVRVLYGAYRRSPEDSSIWDLTPVVELLDWASALTLFLKTGRAAGVVAPARQASRLLGRQNDRAEAEALRLMAEALDQFSENFATVRTGALLLGEKASARRLETVVDGSRESVIRHLPPLADVLPRLRAMVEGLAVEDLGTEQGLRSLGRLARLYLEKERFLEAISLVREAWICRYGSEGAINPGPDFVKEARESAEAEMRRALDGGDYDVSGVRNDLDHAGFRPDPGRACRLKRQVKAHIEKFEQALAAPLPPTSPGQNSGEVSGMRRAVRLAWAALGYNPKPEESESLDTESDLAALDTKLEELIRNRG